MTAMNANSILVIVVGNEFRGDDGVGYAVARQIKKRDYSGIEVVEHQRTGADLIARWQGLKTVFLVDAVSSGADPGTVFRFEIPDEILPKSVFCCSTHSFSVADVIELAKVLGQMPERLIIYGIEGGSFGRGSDLSPEVEVAAEEVASRIDRDIASIKEAYSHARDVVDE